MGLGPEPNRPRPRTWTSRSKPNNPELESAKPDQVNQGAEAQESLPPSPVGSLPTSPAGSLPSSPANVEPAFQLGQQPASSSTGSLPSSLHGSLPPTRSEVFLQPSGKPTVQSSRRELKRPACQPG
ncbi:unnamed protein product [Cuscuta europaea]|uniref:Uncharacterized protein n=1 Tax=Cuscuta europaea TaxID=41803 RepID=A0A9P0YVD2_CUSEU|nr:unnamed protein product [Cuscuta europaea]